MVTVGKFRNEDLSMYFFLKDMLDGKITKIVDGYPYNEIESGSLTVPCASIEHRQTSDEGVGELGASWFRRDWIIDVFATSDTQRDEVADIIFQALDSAISIKDFSGGYNKDTGKKISGADLDVLEYVNPEDRMMRPTYGFNLYARIKYWKITITFETVSTQVN